MNVEELNENLGLITGGYIMSSQKKQVGGFLASCFLIQWEVTVLASPLPLTTPPNHNPHQVLRGQESRGKPQ